MRDSTIVKEKCSDLVILVPVIGKIIDDLSNFQNFLRSKTFAALTSGILILSYFFWFLLPSPWWENAKEVPVNAGPQFAFVAAVILTAAVCEGRKRLSFDREYRRLDDQCTELGAEVRAFMALPELGDKFMAIFL